MHLLLAVVHGAAQAAHAASLASPAPTPSASPAPSGFGAVSHAILHPIFHPIIAGLASLISLINGVVHNLGVSLVVLAVLIRLAFWKLNTAQFKAMMGMQKIAPKLKQLQTKFKEDPQRLQQETMALYKSEGVNPLAGCWPMLVQLPILVSVYSAVISHRHMYSTQKFLWIGSPLAHDFPKWLALNLASADVLLLVIYMVSQYVSMRFSSMPATDPAQAQQMKIMQVISPVMIGYVGFRAGWPSAMVLYWLSYNFLTMLQQLYLIRRYHEPISFLDSDHPITDSVAPEAVPAPKPKKTAALKNGTARTVYKKKKNTKGA